MSESSGRGGNRPGAGRPKASAKLAELESRLRGPLAQIADWLEQRDEELGRVLREDAPKMASLLARVALNTKTPAPLVLAIRGIAAGLEPLDAFGRTLRLLVVRWREARARRREERESELVDDGLVGPPYVDDGGVASDVQVERELAAERIARGTPDRFRADREPPEVE